MVSRRHLAHTALSAIGLTMALTAASCTTETTSTPGPTLTTTIAPTTTAAPTTTIAPTTTAAPTTTEAPTTTVAPTTTLPAGPANAVVPLLVGGAESTGWLSLGAWRQTRWERSADADGNPIAPGISAGTTFTVSNLDGETTATLGANTEACFDGRVGPSVDVDVAPPEPPGFGYGALAVLDQPWELKPRRVAVIDDNIPTAYQALGEAALVDRDVDAEQGSIEQVVVADLDGDGDDEALAVFEHLEPDTGPGFPGDFSVLLLVDVEARTADTVELSAIDLLIDDTSFPIIDRFRVIDLADVNGDGRMEVIVHAWYYEGAAVIAYAYDGTQLTEVLSTGCGA